MPAQPKRMPTVGEEALLMNHLGIFLVEEVHVEARTANLRRLESNALIKDVEWSSIWPLDGETRERLEQLKAEAPIELLRKMVEDHKNRK
jgi:hypothetical protein